MGRSLSSLCPKWEKRKAFCRRSILSLDQYNETIRTCVFRLFQPHIYSSTWRVERKTERREITYSKWPHVGFKPWAATARAQLVDFGRTLNLLGYFASCTWVFSSQHLKKASTDMWVIISGKIRANSQSHEVHCNFSTTNCFDDFGETHLSSVWSTEWWTVKQTAANYSWCLLMITQDYKLRAWGIF